MGVPLGEVIPEGHPRGSSPLARRIDFTTCTVTDANPGFHSTATPVAVLCWQPTSPTVPTRIPRGTHRTCSPSRAS